MSNIIESALDKLEGIAEIDMDAKRTLDIIALMQRMK
jgi:hypothetical protein